jgi:hypothetical protein
MGGILLKDLTHGSYFLLTAIKDLALLRNKHNIPLLLEERYKVTSKYTNEILMKALYKAHAHFLG